MNIGLQMAPQKRVRILIFIGVFIGIAGGLFLHTAYSNLADLNRRYEQGLGDNAWARENHSLEYGAEQGRAAMALRDAIKNTVDPDRILGWLFLFIGLGLIGFGISGKAKIEKKSRIDSSLVDKQTIVALIEKHKELLLAKRKKALIRDDYGYTDIEGWHAEKKDFRDKVILRELNCRSISKSIPFSELVDQVLDATKEEGSETK